MWERDGWEHGWGVGGADVGEQSEGVWGGRGKNRSLKTTAAVPSAWVIFF